MRRSAMSLLELVIALALLATLMTMAIESLTGIRRYVDREQAQNDLLIEGQRVLARISDDLAASGWYFPPPPAMDAPSAAQLCDPSPLVDRAIRYYPYVCMHPFGEGSAFVAHNWRAGEVVSPAVLPPGLPPAHRQASQEIVFVRVARAPEGEREIDFATPPPPITTFAALRVAAPIDVPVTALGLALDASDRVVDLPIAWDAVAAPSAQVDDSLREFSYVVLPEPSTGRGRLVRAVRDGAGNASAAPVSYDQVLSQRVDRVVFDTCRTRADLAVDQVAVALYLSREIDVAPGTFATVRIETTVAMRALADVANQRRVRQRLGGATYAPGGP